MSQYLLSMYSGEGRRRQPMTEEQMKESMQRIVALEAEMDETGTFLFGGRLAAPHTAAVVSPDDGEVKVTDGPSVEAKQHLAGFYIIEAEDRDAAIAWGARVADAVGASIEVRPFVATGRAAEQMNPGAAE